MKLFKTSNPAFERDAAKARRPSTLRYAPFVESVCPYLR